MTAVPFRSGSCVGRRRAAALLGAGGLVLALLVAPAIDASAANVPVLLTGSGAALPKPTVDAIKQLGIKQVVILGGPSRVSHEVEKALAAPGVTSVKRIAGPDRFATAALLADLATDQFGMEGAAAYLANGVTGWPDALAAGPLAGSQAAMVLTVPGTGLPPAATSYLAENTHLTTIASLGTAGTIPAATLAAARTAIV